MFDLKLLLRPNIAALEPYRCARDDYKTGILLDANENTHGPCVTASPELELNRYPDPHQVHLKQLLCDYRNSEASQPSAPLKPENVFVGVGSDEAIDFLIRAVCVPGKDKLLICPPAYGMYSVSAQVNDVQVVRVNQQFYKEDPTQSFDIDADAIIDKVNSDPSIKLIYICSPGNPTGALVDKGRIKKVLANTKWNGLVVVDEAYIDFIMHTLSKAFGLAGIRIGACFSGPGLIKALNSMKAPYNVSTLASKAGINGLSPQGIQTMRKNVSSIIQERQRLVRELPKIPGVGKIIGGFDSNFLLVQILDRPNGTICSARAQQVYKTLAEEEHVVVRYRGNEPGCPGALRISVGTESENTLLLAALDKVLASSA